MGNYTHQHLDLNKRRSQPHPIWRGIGCLLIPVIAVVSYGLAYLMVGYVLGQGMAIPVQLLGYPSMPDLLFKVPGLVSALVWIESTYNLYLYIVMTLLMILLVTGVFSTLYVFLYRLVGPPQYSPLDAPPLNVKIRKRSR